MNKHSILYEFGYIIWLSSNNFIYNFIIKNMQVFFVKINNSYTV